MTRIGAPTNIGLLDSRYVNITGDTMTGPLLLDPSADSTALFRVRNTALTNTFLNIDSSTTPSNLITNPSFETDTTGWAAKGAASIARSTAQSYFGVAALRVTTTAAAGDGTKWNITLSNSTRYNVTLFLKLVSGSFNLTSAGFMVGYSQDGSDETTTISPRFKATSTGWTKVTFTFTTPATNSGTPYLFFKQETAAVRVFDIDGVIAATMANATDTNTYYEGKAVFGDSAIITEPIVMMSTINTTQFFGIIGSSGRALLTVDTLNNALNINFPPSSQGVQMSLPQNNQLNVMGNLGFGPTGIGASLTAGINLYDGVGTRTGAFFMEPNGTGDMYFGQIMSGFGSISLRTGGLTNTFNKFVVDVATGYVGVGSGLTAPGGRFHVSGTNDVIQTLVTANATQTALLSVWEDSTNADIITFSGLGAAVFNEQGSDADHRIEGDTDANLFFLDASTDSIGIGTNAPTAWLHVKAGTTAQPSFKIDTGTLLTTAEAGSIEYNNNWYLTKSSALRYSVGGVISDNYADAGNVGTGEDDLYSYTTPANTLNTNGDKIEANYAGIFLSSATATRRLKLYFGGTEIYDSTALSLSTSADWDAKVIIIRESSTVVRCSVTVNTTTASSAPYCKYTRILGLTLSSTNILKITGEAAGVGAATDDIIAKIGVIKFIPAI